MSSPSLLSEYLTHLASSLIFYLGNWATSPNMADQATPDPALKEAVESLANALRPPPQPPLDTLTDTTDFFLRRQCSSMHVALFLSLSFPLLVVAIEGGCVFFGWRTHMWWLLIDERDDCTNYLHILRSSCIVIESSFCLQ